MKAYSIAAWLVVALGALQIASTPRFFHELSSSALWFACGGLALILTGALNLLNRAYGRDAPGVRWSSRIANVVMTGFLALDGIVDHAGATEFIAVMALMCGVTALSLTRSALNKHDAPAA